MMCADDFGRPLFQFAPDAEPGSGRGPASAGRAEDADHHEHRLQGDCADDAGDASSEQNADGDPDGQTSDPDRLRAAILQLTAEVDDARARYQRALADYSNFQRRSRENERLERVQGRAEVMRAIIPALDNFERALDIPASSEGEKRLHDGLRLVRQELMQALGQQGMALIEPQSGDEFLPGQHEAMLRVPTNEIDANCVAQLLQAGYRLNDLVLRPAKVSVTVPAADDDHAADGPGEDA